MKNIFKNELKKQKINRDIKTWSSHPIRWLSKDDILSKDNILLVGDAAGIEPATGGGIHLALSYGELAAKTILEAYEQNNFSYGDYTDKVKSHLIGKFINKLTELALEMYSLKTNPLDVAKQIFLKK